MNNNNNPEEGEEQSLRLYYSFRQENDETTVGVEKEGRRKKKGIAVTLSAVKGQHGSTTSVENNGQEQLLTMTEIQNKWKEQSNLVSSSAESAEEKRIFRLRIKSMEKEFWRNVTDNQWISFCNAITHLPHVSNLVITGAGSLKDEQLALLLQHISPKLEKLSLFSIEKDIPKTFQQIGRRRQLQSLILCGIVFEENLHRVEECLSLKSFRNLATSLKQLIHLKKISIRNLAIKDEECLWDPILQVLRSNPNLVEVTVNGGWKRLEREEQDNIRDPQRRTILRLLRRNGRDFRFIELPQDIVNAVQFGPRISKATKHLFLASSSSSQAPAPAPAGTSSVVTTTTSSTSTPTTTTTNKSGSVEAWISAILSVKDRLDCVHYLVSRMDPHMLRLGDGGGDDETKKNKDQTLKRKRL